MEDSTGFGIWLKLFLEAQGIQVSQNYFEQDNVSAIRLERNGRSSAGAKSRHIDIRYFWIKDRVKSEDITIRHCPTTEMLADFLQNHYKAICSVNFVLSSLVIYTPYH